MDSVPGRCLDQSFGRFDRCVALTFQLIDGSLPGKYGSITSYLEKGFLPVSALAFIFVTVACLQGIAVKTVLPGRPVAVQQVVEKDPRSRKGASGLVLFSRALWRGFRERPWFRRSIFSSGASHSPQTGLRCEMRGQAVLQQRGMAR
jgi:hypothetical protein